MSKGLNWKIFFVQMKSEKTRNIFQYVFFLSLSFVRWFINPFKRDQTDIYYTGCYIWDWQECTSQVLSGDDFVTSIWLDK